MAFQQTDINLSHRSGQSHREKIPGMRVKATPVGETIPYWGNAEEIIRSSMGARIVIPISE